MLEWHLGQDGRQRYGTCIAALPSGLLRVEGTLEITYSGANAYDSANLSIQGEMTLLVATRNRGKKREFRELLAPLDAAICFPDDLDLHLEVREDGTTYAENAYKKAQSYAIASGLPTLADDSGLEVDALLGAPGIHSARYAPGSDKDRTAALLSRMPDIPWEDRTARFRCVVVIVTPGGDAQHAEGTCEGIIAFEPAGGGGFGYDPVFYLPEYACTMAQLSREEKNRISHRARAVQAVFPTLRRLVEQG